MGASRGLLPVYIKYKFVKNEKGDLNTIKSYRVNIKFQTNISKNILNVLIIKYFESTVLFITLFKIKAPFTIKNTGTA